MATKFYKGQKVQSNKFGRGIVHFVLDDASTPYPVAVLFESEKGAAIFTADGRHVSNQPIDLFPADQPKPILTEWQEGRFRELMGDVYCNKTPMIEAVAIMNNILSEPDPPKWEPKQGEAVLVRANHTDQWHPRVFTEMNGPRYQCYALIDTDKCNWNYCRPFDPSLVGKVTD